MWYRIQDAGQGVVNTDHQCTDEGGCLREAGLLFAYEGDEAAHLLREGLEVGAFGSGIDNLEIVSFRGDEVDGDDGGPLVRPTCEVARQSVREWLQDTAPWFIPRVSR